MPPTSEQQPRRIVIKLGTGILTSGVGKLDESRIANICKQVAALRDRGIAIIVVSSGAIGLGMGKLGLRKRPADLCSLQACAAIGQTMLMQMWQKHFALHGRTVGQVLLTHEDVRARTRHVAVRNTIERLLALDVIPVINENDAVSAHEIKFGDNDILSALVASLTKAELLVILSTIPGLLDREREDTLIPVVEAITPEIEGLAGDTHSATSVGGMRSKIEAARVATRSGCAVFIGSGDEPSLLLQVLSGDAKGTLFVPARIAMRSRKRWIAFFEKPKGAIRIDPGAVRAIRDEGRSLLPGGVRNTQGTFSEGDVVNIESREGVVVARGVARYSSEMLPGIQGKRTDELRALYPDRSHFEVVHRDTLVILAD